jgi:protein-tyrosine-phosphatase
VKVLFVCDGNICRSPLAAEYLRHRAVRERLSHLVVDSAGLLGIVGAHAAPFSIEVGREVGLDLTRHRSRGVVVADMKTSDLVVAMTLRQLDTLARRFPAGDGRRLLLRAFENRPEPEGGAPELDDPVAGPIEDYRKAFSVIRACVDHLVLYLKHVP